jgi:hypothetical protein
MKLKVRARISLLSRIYWLRDGVEVDGISIDYRAIVLHAISRSSPIEGKSSIYMQIAATKLKLSDGTECGGEIDEEDVLEISLVPEANDTGTFITLLIYLLIL